MTQHARLTISFLLCLSLILEQTAFAQAIDLSGYFASNPAQAALRGDKFRPLHLRYISYDNQANDFKILLDKGDYAKGLSHLAPSEAEGQGTIPEGKLEQETQELMKYFFIGLALPNDKFWVNLRPDSPENILDPDLEKTDIGRIFLEADLQLKKDTSGFTSPQTPEGRQYWDKLYKRAGELFGTENITIPTITRPWIVPNEIIIREAPDSAYIYKATLKVMLEEDYIRSPGHQVTKSPNQLSKPNNQPLTSNYNFSDPRLKELNEYSTELIRETIIPKLTYEINTSKRYAHLRQVYYSLILAQWFKARFRSQITENRAQSTEEANNYLKLIDSGNLTSNLQPLTTNQPYSKESYFKQYQRSFKEGEYNLSEQVSSPQGQSMRRYVSGGMLLGEPLASSAVTSKIPSGGRSYPFLKNIPAYILALSVVFSSFIKVSEAVIIDKSTDSPVRYHAVQDKEEQALSEVVKDVLWKLGVGDLSPEEISRSVSMVMKDNPGLVGKESDRIKLGDTIEITKLVIDAFIKLFLSKCERISDDTIKISGRDCKVYFVKSKDSIDLAHKTVGVTVVDTIIIDLLNILKQVEYKRNLLMSNPAGFSSRNKSPAEMIEEQLMSTYIHEQVHAWLNILLEQGFKLPEALNSRLDELGELNRAEKKRITHEFAAYLVQIYRSSDFDMELYAMIKRLFGKNNVIGQERPKEEKYYFRLILEEVFGKGMEEYYLRRWKGASHGQIMERIEAVFKELIGVDISAVPININSDGLGVARKALSIPHSEPVKENQGGAKGIEVYLNPALVPKTADNIEKKELQYFKVNTLSELLILMGLEEPFYNGKIVIRVERRTGENESYPGGFPDGKSVEVKDGDIVHINPLKKKPPSASPLDDVSAGLPSEPVFIEENSAKMRVNVDNAIVDVLAAAERYGLEIGFAGSKARWMLFGQEGHKDMVDSDIDIAVLKDKKNNAQTLGMRVLNLIKDLKDESHIEVEVLNILDIDDYSVIRDPFAKVENNRTFSVNRVIVSKKEGQWIASGKIPGYGKDIEGKVLRLIPEEKGDGRQRSMSLIDILRNMRIMLEYPELKITEESRKDIKMVAAGIEYERYAQAIKDLWNSPEGVDWKSPAGELESFLKIFLRARSPDDIIPLFKEMGEGAQTLFEVFNNRIGINLGSLVAIIKEQSPDSCGSLYKMYHRHIGEGIGAPGLGSAAGTTDKEKIAIRFLKEAAGLLAGIKQRPKAPVSLAISERVPAVIDGDPVSGKVNIALNDNIKMIFAAAKKYGVKIAIVGGAAREIIFNQNGDFNSTDIDIAILGYDKGIRYALIDLLKDEGWRVSSFLGELDNLSLPLEIINEDKDSFRFDDPYFRFDRVRDLTINRLMVYQKGSQWIIASDVQESSYIKDIKELRLTNIPSKKENGERRLSLSGVLRYARARLEYPDAVVDEDTARQINEFVDKMSDNDVIDLGRIEEWLENSKIKGDDRFEDDKINFKAALLIYIHAKEKSKIPYLLHQIGGENRRLDSLLKDAGYLLRFGEQLKPANLHDFIYKLEKLWHYLRTGNYELNPRASSGLENINERLLAPVERGTGWMRIAATPEEAYVFHREYSSQLSGSYETEFMGRRYSFPKRVWAKMIDWSEGSPDFERMGYFIARQDNGNGYKILDFVPMGSVAADPDMIPNAKADPFTSQASSANFELFGIDNEVAAALGVDLGIQDKLSFINVASGSKDLISIPYHSHHRGSGYSESPSEADYSQAKSNVRFLYSLSGSGKGFLYHGEKGIYGEVKSSNNPPLASSINGDIQKASSGIDQNDGKGGIAFNVLPIQTEPVASSSLSVLRYPSPVTRLPGFDLDDEWSRIQDVFNAGIRPSIQRLAEFSAAAAASPLAEEKIDEIRVMLADILRREEEDDKSPATQPALKELVAALEPDNPA